MVGKEPSVSQGGDEREGEDERMRNENENENFDRGLHLPRSNARAGS